MSRPTTKHNIFYDPPGNLFFQNLKPMHVLRNLESTSYGTDSEDVMILLKQRNFITIYPCIETIYYIYLYKNINVPLD